MNKIGGVANIIVACIILIFVLMVLMQPISLLTDQADNQLANLQSHTRQAKDLNGSTVTMSGGASYGDLTMTILFGMGTIFFIGIIIYIIRFGPSAPPQSGGGYYPQ